MDWEVIGGVVGLLVLYTKIVFDYSKIQTEIKSTNTVLIEIKSLLVNHDDKIDKNHELAKANANAIVTMQQYISELKQLRLDNRLSEIEIKHNEYHKEWLDETE